MKAPLVIRILQDMLADKTRVKVTPDEVTGHCEKLAEKIRGEYGPNYVVAIATGGSVPGEIISQILGVPIVHISVRRNINISRRYSRDPTPLRWMMSLYHHFLFQTTKPTISVGVGIDLTGKKILVVEDTVHTGATIDVVVDHLKSVNAMKIKVASLAFVSKTKPDFSALPSGNYSFPWSKDYVE